MSDYQGYRWMYRSGQKDERKRIIKLLESKNVDAEIIAIIKEEQD